MEDALLTIFDPDGFEQLVAENGKRYWRASDLMRLLGYTDFQTFKKAINKAMAACATLEISPLDNFEAIREPGKPDDYKLSRFACYLTTMNGDPRKPTVAAAQAYFARLAESVRQYFQEADNVERICLRSKVSEHEKSLSGIANKAGVEMYPYFQNAGYRGMYNMNLSDLKAYKGIDGRRCLLDFMGKTELAGNLFRITQTEEKIRNEGIRGQRALETTAHQVGQRVRNAMMEIGGTAPEDLPIEENIKTVQTGIKKTHRRFSKMDTKALPSPEA